MENGLWRIVDGECVILATEVTDAGDGGEEPPRLKVKGGALIIGGGMESPG